MTASDKRRLIPHIPHNLYDVLDESERDDKLAIVYENNVNNLISVQTPFGMTNRKNIQKLELQGSVWGPIKCSVQNSITIMYIQDT